MNHEIMRGNNYAAQICIDGYDSKILCGRLQSAALDSEMSFGSLMEFFCEMEQLLDQTLPMQAFTERRTFRSVPSAPQQQSAMTRTPGRSLPLSCASCSGRTPAGRARSSGSRADRRSASAAHSSLFC